MADSNQIGTVAPVEPVPEGGKAEVSETAPTEAEGPKPRCLNASRPCQPFR